MLGRYIAGLWRAAQAFSVSTGLTPGRRATTTNPFSGELHDRS